MVDGWRVRPDGVAAVLSAVQREAHGVAQALKPLADAGAGGAAAADGLSSAQVCTAGPQSAGLISAAMQAFLADISPSLRTIEQRIPAATNGMVDAVNAVEAGDETMATAIQNATTGAFGYGPLARAERPQ